jgi:tetratricopeptide (TPR) repeat protein
MLSESKGAMKTKYLLILFFTIVSLSGCARMHAGQDVILGRQALLVDKNETAQYYFQNAAKISPNYTYWSVGLLQGVWSYVGRTEYLTGRYPQARQSLERALSANRNENKDIARLYLGLTLAREGDRQRGVKEIEAGMRGIHDWLDYVNQAYAFTYGKYWDATQEIRSTIRTDLAMISGRDVDLQRLIAEGEWLGIRMELESDRAKRQQMYEWNRNNGGRNSRR